MVLPLPVCASLFVRPTKERAHCALCSLLLVPSPCTWSGIRGTDPEVAVRYDTAADMFSHLLCFWLRR